MMMVIKRGMMLTLMFMMMPGEVETSVDQLLNLKPSAQLPLVNPRKKGKQPRYKVRIFCVCEWNFHFTIIYVQLQPSVYIGSAINKYMI